MKSTTKAASASIIGCILEVYDFVIYGVLASHIGSLYFPSSHPELSLIATMGVFAAGYLARPLGAILFGHLGDRIGRKKSLSLSIFFMAIPTFAIGVLPTYEAIGVTAPVLLILFRLLQGIGISGEFSGAIIFLIEHFGKKRAGFATSFVSGGGRLGAFLATLTGALCLNPDLPSWGWRIPFVLGSLLAFVGLYIRLNLEETPVFKKEVENTGQIVRTPLLTALKEHPYAVLCIFMGAAFDGSLATAVLVYTGVYLTKVVHVPAHEALLLSSCGLFYYTILAPFAGLLTDRIGSIKLMTLSSICIFTTVYPAFLLFQTEYIPYIIVGQLVLFTFVGFFSAAFNPMAAQLFPANIRYSGVAFSYNLGIALLGGAMPLIATTLIYWTGNNMMPPLYLMVGCIVGLVVAWGGKRLAINATSRT